MIVRNGEKELSTGPVPLPTPLAVVEHALRSPSTARKQLPNYRLTQLVASRGDMDDADIRLVKAGVDNRWLRRVPMTWHAADGIACMKRAGVLGDWARLVALYPGW